MKTGRSHLLATGLYSLIAMGFLGPLSPTREVWGGRVSDVFNHLHILHWQAQAARSGRIFPVYDELLHHPVGGTLFLADPIGNTAMVPLAWIAGPMFAANILVLLNLVFACWAMFFLVRRLTGDAWAAFPAGLVFGLSPLSLGHAHNGVWELLQTGWIPLFVGCLLATFTLASRAADEAQRPPPRQWIGWLLAAAAAWFAAALASHWYYGMYAGLLFGLLVLVHGAGRRRWRVWAYAGAVLAVTAVLVAPIIWLFIQSTHSEISLTRGLAPGEWAAFKVADPAFFFRPRPPEIETFLHLTYPSATVVLAVAAGVALGIRRMPIVAWLAAAAFFGALSLGPSLVWNGETVSLGPLDRLLPHHLFAATVPVYESMEFPYRLFVMVHLCLAIALGHGLAGPWRARIPVRLAVFILCSVYVAEIAVNSGAPFPMSRQAIEPVGPAEELREAPGDFAIFDLPLRFDLPTRHRYVIEQLFHGRPILYSNFPTAPFPFTAAMARDSLATNVFRLADGSRTPRESPWSGTLAPFSPGRAQEQAWELHDCLLGAQDCDPGALAELDADLSRMSEHRITHFVIHTDLLRPRSRIPELCELLFGPCRWRTERTAVHVLDDPPKLGDE